MKHNPSRAQLLRGDLSSKREVFRPPWSIPELAFIEVCTGCGECAAVCFDQLIAPGRGKLPEMDFSRGGCDFCGECLKVCKPGALKFAQTTANPWEIKATILSSCLSLNAVVCRSCGEACEEQAIRFKLETGGVARPSLDSERCSGCGACFSVCPIQAVNLSSRKQSSDQAA